MRRDADARRRRDLAERLHQLSGLPGGGAVFEVDHHRTGRMLIRGEHPGRGPARGRRQFGGLDHGHAAEGKRRTKGQAGGRDPDRAIEATRGEDAEEGAADRVAC